MLVVCQRRLLASHNASTKSCVSSRTERHSRSRLVVPPDQLARGQCDCLLRRPECVFMKDDVAAVRDVKRAAMHATRRTHTMTYDYPINNGQVSVYDIVTMLYHRRPESLGYVNVLRASSRNFAPACCLRERSRGRWQRTNVRATSEGKTLPWMPIVLSLYVPSKSQRRC